MRQIGLVNRDIRNMRGKQCVCVCLCVCVCVRGTHTLVRKAGDGGNTDAARGRRGRGRAERFS